MKKIAIIVLGLSSLMFADKVSLPISPTFLSLDNGGTLSASDSYRDGIGIYFVSPALDNKEMNSLVYKYGPAAKENNSTLKNYILNAGDNQEDRNLALNLGKFKPAFELDGSLCDDGNSETFSDKYVNGVCVGKTQMDTETPNKIVFSGYYNTTLNQGSIFHIRQSVPYHIDGSVAAIGLGDDNIYLEFGGTESGSFIAINPIDYKATGELRMPMGPYRTIGVFYNSETKYATMCVNGTGCMRYLTDGDSLNIMIASWTTSVSGVTYIEKSNHNKTYKQNTYNFSL